MIDLQLLQSINERDVDLLILEELNISTRFAHWFVTRVLCQPVIIRKVGAWHSVIDPTLGESDLVFIYQSDDGSDQAILIENKIDASAQPEQGLRYTKRGEKGIEHGRWVDFKTCLIAPKKYLDANTESYDSSIAYEEIMAVFVSEGDERGVYRANFIKEAIEKNRRGYKAAVSDEMTNFAKDYLKYVQDNHPQLNPETSKPRAPGNTWIRFFPNPMDKNTQIVHQIYGNAVKLMFFGQAEQYEAIVAKFEKYPDEGLSVYRSGKSVIVEAETSKIDPLTERFEDVKPQIDEAIDLALAFLEKHHDQ
ncbi:PD-(D/E)XK nuclease superfamily protein [Vibrio kyushuensis]|uniref:PD-(D/E)XK nuclease superfamily protein n=1 Tax=Vibrio kyushuensis TaxID=2910249 RepID=UPI003D11E05B